MSADVDTSKQLTFLRKLLAYCRENEFEDDATAYGADAAPLVETIECLMTHRQGTEESKLLLSCVQSFMNCSSFDKLVCDKSNLPSVVHFLTKDVKGDAYVGDVNVQPSREAEEKATATAAVLFHGSQCSALRSSSRLNVITDLKRILKEAIRDLEVTEYGAGRNSFLLHNSDIDLSLDSPAFGGVNGDQLGVVKRRIDSERNNGTTIGNHDILFCKIVGRVRPIVLLKLQHKTSKNLGRTDVNISLQNHVPIVNSKFLSCYQTFGDVVHTFCTLVKLWTSVRKIKGSDKGYFSSYFWHIIAIFFLEQLKQPIVFNLLHPPKHLKHTLRINENENPYLVYYELPVAASPSSSTQEFDEAIKSYLTNRSSVPELLYQFFKFFTFEFDRFKYAVSLRYVQTEGTPPYMLKSDLLRRSNNSSMPKETDELEDVLGYPFEAPRYRECSLICVDDPFRDRVMSSPRGKVHCKKIMMEFERATQLLSDGFQLHKVFENK